MICEQKYMETRIDLEKLILIFANRNMDRGIDYGKIRLSFANNYTWIEG